MSNIENLEGVLDQLGRMEHFISVTLDNLKKGELAATVRPEAGPANTGSLQLLCDIKELLLNHDTPSKESRTIIIARINESIAQQQAGA